MAACLHCGTVEASKKCSRCLSGTYCSKECQRSDWPHHKSRCHAKSLQRVTNGKELLETLEISRIRSSQILPPSLHLHDTNSNMFVMDGMSKTSKTRLWTFSPATCVVIAVIGKGLVFLQHLSGWNAKGNPFGKNPIRLKDLLPRDFEFVKGYVIPGYDLRSWGDVGYSIMRELLWESLEGIGWKQNLKLLEGCTAGLVFDVSVKSGFQIYKSVGGDVMKSLSMPSMNECTQQ